MSHSIEEGQLVERERAVFLLDVLKRAWNELSLTYDGPVGNCCTCSSCFVHGLGTPAEHRADCDGVRLLADVGLLISRMS